MLPLATVALVLELVTVGPADDAYWGDCALRVIDRDAGTDRLYGRYLTGSYVESLRGWAEADRTVTRRALALDAAATASVARELRAVDWGQPQGEFDRGAAQLAEILDRAAGGQMKAQALQKPRGNLRENILAEVRSRPLEYLWLDLTLDEYLSRHVLTWDRRVLCSALSELSSRTVIHGKRFVSEERDEYRSRGLDDGARWSWPWILVYVLWTAPLVVLALVRPRWGLAAFVVLASALGVRLLLSAAPMTIVLAFSPIHLLLLSPRGGLYARPYFTLQAVMLVVLVLLPGTEVFRPAIAAVLPVVLVLILRLKRPPGPI